MRVCFIFLSLSMSLSLFSKEVNFEGNHFLISETGKGYFNYFVYDKNNNPVPSLESGSLVNNRIFIRDEGENYYLRSVADFKHEITSDSLVLIWETKALKVTEKYSLLNEGVNYSVKVENKTGWARSVGVYLIYNTYLGESDKNHFIVEDHIRIRREKLYEYDEIPLSLKSVNSSDIGLEFRFGDENTTRPDKVVLGNWERLARSKKWPYIPRAEAAFSYGFYSINDSAVGIVYNVKKIKPLSSIEHSYNMFFITNMEVDTKVDIPVEPVEQEIEEVEEALPLLDEPEVEETDVIMEEPLDIVLPVVELEDVVIEDDKPLDPEREELLRMLDFIQKKKRGEDVSGYDFDENYIIEKFKEKNE